MRRQPARLQLGRRDAADRREVAGDERQHAGGEEGDDARGEGGEDAHSGGRIGAQCGEDHGPPGYSGRLSAALRRHLAAAGRGETAAVELFNASGARRRLRASPLFAIGPSEPGPALRRGFLVAVPVGLALILELGLDSPTKGAIGTGALLAGFPGDGRAGAAAGGLAGGGRAADRHRRRRSACSPAPTPSSPSPTMAVVGAAGRLLLRRLAAPLDRRPLGGALAADRAGPAARPRRCAAGAAARHRRRPAAGGLLALRLGGGRPRGGGRGERLETGRPRGRRLRDNLTLRSTSFRHGLRFGAALAAGVALYWLLGMHEHGFWIPLTILFVLRPEEDETFRRLALRAIGTAVGLVIATALAEWLRGDELAIAVCLTIATGFAYGLLTVQYALFTAAITTYAVLLADSIGEPALHAAGERALGTALGIVDRRRRLPALAQSRRRAGRRAGLQPADPLEAPVQRRGRPRRSKQHGRSSRSASAAPACGRSSSRRCRRPSSARRRSPPRPRSCACPRSGAPRPGSGSPAGRCSSSSRKPATRPVDPLQVVVDVAEVLVRARRDRLEAAFARSRRRLRAAAPPPGRGRAPRARACRSARPGWCARPRRPRARPPGSRRRPSGRRRRSRRRRGRGSRRGRRRCRARAGPAGARPAPGPSSARPRRGGR